MGESGIYGDFGPGVSDKRPCYQNFGEGEGGGVEEWEIL